MIRIALLAAVAASLALAVQPAAGTARRDVLVVSSNRGGTADLVDPHRFKRIKRLNVIPDAVGRTPYWSAAGDDGAGPSRSRATIASR
jgi:hypothetical protein